MKKNNYQTIGLVLLIAGLGWAVWATLAKRAALKKLQEIKIKYSGNFDLSADSLKELYKLAEKAYTDIKEAWKQGGIFFGTNVPEPKAGSGSSGDDTFDKP